MTRPVLAIDPGARHVGLALCHGPDVLEACTVSSRETVSIESRSLDLPALVDLAARAVGTGVDMLRDHANVLAERGGVVLTVVEAVSVPQPQKRAVGAGPSGIAWRVIASAQGLAANAAVVVAGLYAAGLGEPLIVPADGFDHKKGHPTLLDGRVPKEWLRAHPDRQRRGQPREHQRAAYHLAQAGLRQAGGIQTVKPLFPAEPVKAVAPATPVTRAAYLAALLAHMAGDVTVQAAQVALAAIPAPPGAPALPAQALADHAERLKTRSA